MTSPSNTHNVSCPIVIFAVWNTASWFASHNKKVLPVKGSASLISDVLSAQVPEVLTGCKNQDRDIPGSDLCEAVKLIDFSLKHRISFASNFHAIDLTNTATS